MATDDPQVAEKEAEMSKTNQQIVKLQEDLAAQAEAGGRQEEVAIPEWTRLEASAGYWICMLCSRVNRPDVRSCGGSVLIGQSARPEAVVCVSRRWHFDREDKVFFLSNPTYRAAADWCRQARSLYIASKRQARNDPTEEHSRQQEDCLEEWNAHRSLVRQMAAKQALS